MALTLEVKLEDLSSRKLERFDTALRDSEKTHRYIAAEASYSTEQHFKRKRGEPNKRGWKHSGFWNQMIASVKPLATKEAAIVRMSSKMAQRRFGGTILPTGGKKFLAIPAREEAYGITARAFRRFPLSFVPTGPDKGILVREDEPESAHGGAFYFLVRSVTQTADPSVRPSDDDYLQAARKGLASYLQTLEKNAH